MNARPAEILANVVRGSEVVTKIITAITVLSTFVGLLWTITYVALQPGGFAGFDAAQVGALAPVIAIRGFFMLMLLAWITILSGAPFMPTWDRSMNDPDRMHLIQQFYASLIVISILLLIAVSVLHAAIGFTLNGLLLFAITPLALASSFAVANNTGRRSKWYTTVRIPGLVVCVVWSFSLFFNFSLVGNIAQSESFSSDKLATVAVLCYFIVLTGCTAASFAIPRVKAGTFFFVALCLSILFFSPRFASALPFNSLGLGRRLETISVDDTNRMNTYIEHCKGSPNRTGGLGIVKDKLSNHYTLDVYASIGNRYIVKCDHNWLEMNIEDSRTRVILFPSPSPGP